MNHFGLSTLVTYVLLFIFLEDTRYTIYTRSITSSLMSFKKLKFCCIIQVLIQPFFAFVEEWSREKWPESKFIEKEYSIGSYSINLFRLTWRTIYVILVTLVAMIFPFFNSFMGLIGAATYWPLTIYFPIEMYISQAKIQRGSFTWIWLKILSFTCLIVALLAAAGSIRGLYVSVSSFELFRSVSQTLENFIIVSN